MHLDGREYPPGVVWDCQDAFVIEGKALARIADEQPVSLSTLKRWSVDFEWVSLRNEYRRKESEIRTAATDARLKLISKVATAGDPMAAFGYSSLEGTLNKARELALKEEALKVVPEKLRPIETPDDIAAAIGEAIQIKLARMASDPDQLNFASVRDLLKAKTLVDSLTAEVDSSDRPEGGLDASTAEEIRRKILFGEKS